MTRSKLPNRRANETRRIMFRSIATGNEQTILITVGFDDVGIAKEVFCADFKEGSDLHAVVMDACVLVSRNLQHGDAAAELLESMCQGPSLIGAIVKAVSDFRGPSTARDAQGRPRSPRPRPPASAAVRIEIEEPMS
jgi:hypothetical protein